MKFPRMNPYYRGALVLIAAAVVLVTVAVLTGRNDLVSAALVLAALACLLTGIFLSLLSTGEPVASRYTGLFAVPGCISLTRVAADLGIAGNAYILPKERTGPGYTMQYVPVADYDGSALPGGETFVATATAAGQLTLPAGLHLLRELEKHDSLVIPREMPALFELVQEVTVEVLAVADRVTVSEDGQVVTVTMDGYHLLSGCRAMTEESLKCCSTNPCPSCSLCACILAEGTGKVVRVERCSPGTRSGSVVAVYSLLP